MKNSNIQNLDYYESVRSGRTKVRNIWLTPEKWRQ